MYCQKLKDVEVTFTESSISSGCAPISNSNNIKISVVQYTDGHIEGKLVQGGFISGQITLYSTDTAVPPTLRILIKDVPNQ